MQKLCVKFLVSARRFLPVLALAIAAPAFSQSKTVVISQLYGAGGNSGATYNADYVELFNLGTTTVALDGWALQYGSATGTTISVVNLIPSGFSLKPGQYILFQATPGTTGAALPVTADATISTIALAATAGKVYLTNSTTQLSGSCVISGGSIVDFVGYGTTTTCAEGSPTGATAAAPAPSTTLADIRNSSCIDTDNNANDFKAAPPAPHNQATTLAPCTTAAPTAPTLSNTAATPSTVYSGSATLLTTTVTKGSSAISTVTVDLSGLGGSSTQMLYDDGTHGDVTAGDGIYSYSETVPSGQAANTYTLNFKATDASSLTATGTATLIVQTPVASGPIALSGAKGTPSTVVAGSTSLLTVSVTPGTLPTSTGIAVSGDLSAFGGSTTQAFYDDGTHGDVTAGDGTYSYTLTVPSSQSATAYTINLKASDSQARTATTTLPLTVQAPAAAAVTGTVSSSASSATAGTSVTFTAVLTGNKTSSPTGTVTFYDGTTQLGQGTLIAAGTWTYATTSLAVGNHVITFIYGGDSVYPSYTLPSTSGTTVTITVAPVADFTLALGNLSLIATDHNKVQTTTVSVAMNQLFSGTVNLTCSGAPAGTSCAFSPTSLSKSGISILTIAIDNAALQQRNRRGMETALALTLLVLPFAFRRRLRSGLGTALGLIVMGIALTAMMSGCGSDNSTPDGSSTITVTATGGGITHTATLSLNVQ